MTSDNDKAAKFGTTLDYMMSVPEFAVRANVIEAPPHNPLVSYNLADQAGLFFRVLRAAVREKALLLLSSRGSFKPELLAIMAISFWPRRYRPAIVLNGPMWEPDRGIRGVIERIIVRLVDRAINRYAVQSSAELEVFPRTWGLDPTKVRFTPYMFSITDRDMALPPPRGDHIFAGGNSFRNYEALLAAARQLPDFQFVLATRRLDGRADLPSNVVANLVPHDRFVALMRSAVAVVVPMQQGLRRAVGQQTYLNGMWLKKPTIVNDVLGVHDHVRHRETGLIVDGSPESYVEALRWVLDPANSEQVKQMCENAHLDVATRFSWEKHADYLLAVMKEII